MPDVSVPHHRRRWYCLLCGKLNHARRARCVKCAGDCWVISFPEDVEAAGVILECKTQVWRHPKTGRSLDVPLVKVCKVSRSDRLLLEGGPGD